MPGPVENWPQTGQTGQATFPFPGAPGGIAVDPTKLSPGKYLLTLTLNRVIELLISSIQSMSSVAVVQSNRLTFLTQWQQAYTQEMNSVHTFALGGKDAYLSGDDSSLTTIRENLNNIDSAFLEQLRSNNSLVSDVAKGLQTNVNQTEDATNQQANQCSSLLQEMSSIISALFNG